MLNVHNLSVSFQGEYLFEEVAFMLNAGDRVGLIGKNGAGKSTMLKLLSRELKPDSGTIAADKDVRIGFLKQDIDFVKGRTILEEAYQAFGEIKSLEQKLDDIPPNRNAYRLRERKLSQSTRYAKRLYPPLRPYRGLPLPRRDRKSTLGVGLSAQ